MKQRRENGKFLLFAEMICYLSGKLRSRAEKLPNLMWSVKWLDKRQACYPAHRNPLSHSPRWAIHMFSFLFKSPRPFPSLPSWRLASEVFESTEAITSQEPHILNEPASHLVCSLIFCLCSCPRGVNILFLSRPTPRRVLSTHTSICPRTLLWQTSPSHSCPIGVFL